MLTALRLVVFILVFGVACAGAEPGRQIATTVTHEPILLYSAGPGDSTGAFPQEMGLNGRIGDAVTSAQGILSIIPGERWANFVGAAKPGIPYVIKSVVLELKPGEPFPWDESPARPSVLQSQPDAIRLWWPLVYTRPGDMWILTILYGTEIQWDDDAGGRNPLSYLHKEVWKWKLDANVSSIGHLIEVFHQTPWGRSQAPLLSDEALLARLERDIALIQAALDAGDSTVAGLLVGDMEMETMDACIATSPAMPNPTGPGTGIANTTENPACTKLLSDCEALPRMGVCCY